MQKLPASRAMFFGKPLAPHPHHQNIRTQKRLSSCLRLVDPPPNYRGASSGVTWSRRRGGGRIMRRSCRRLPVCGRILARDAHASTNPSCHSPIISSASSTLSWICAEATRNDCCSATKTSEPSNSACNATGSVLRVLKPRAPQLPASNDNIARCLSNQSRLRIYLIHDDHQAIPSFSIPYEACHSICTAEPPNQFNMKLSLVTLAAAVGLASSQCVSSIPQCAQSCLMIAAGSVGCGETDYTCQCTQTNQQDITNNATTCVLAACGEQTAISRCPPLDDIVP